MREYILSLCACSLFLCLINIILPDSSFRKYASMVCSLVLATVMLTPLTKSPDNVFSDFDQNIEIITQQQAKDEYLYRIRRGYEDDIIKALSKYGRVAVNIADDLTVKSIIIYTQIGTEIDKEQIQNSYSPESIEVIYE